MIKEMRTGDIRKGDILKADIGAFTKPLKDGTIYFFEDKVISNNVLSGQLITVCDVNRMYGEIFNVMTAEFGKISIWPNGINHKIFLQKRV